MRTYIATGFQILNGKKVPFKSCKVTGYCKNHAMTRATFELEMHHSLIKIKSI